MKIATYNVWNENKGVGKRFKQLIHEINTVDADIIGLQEVTPFFYNNILVKETNYKYCIYGKYQGEEEGLAILSKYPINTYFFLHEIEEYSYSNALVVFLNYMKFNFHLQMFIYHRILLRNKKPKLLQ